ncbi:TadE/TadG family type IV pilus assembly protein [Massilia sp. S19_KUP03_FR1]|uniref:TadE/TadG family type IV pilus assembly protein n=1 Tax=Massilia sp. S19_KUP03_FR1 TaxID=3025503 RepID=UPI002FCD8D9D
MKRTRKMTGPHYARGSIAVEAAILLPILVLFLGLPSILCAFYFRQYTAVQKAAHDAAIYLSTAPKLEMTMAGPDGNFAALTLAKRIVMKELAGIVPAVTTADPTITCYYTVASTLKNIPCTPQIFNLDTRTLFQFDVTVSVPFINPVTGREVDAMYMTTTVTARYVGN